MFIDRSRNSDNINVAVSNIFKQVGKLHPVRHGFFDLIFTQFQCPVYPAFKLIDTPLGDVEADYFILFTERMRQWQTYVP